MPERMEKKHLVRRRLDMGEKRKQHAWLRNEKICNGKTKGSSGRSAKKREMKSERKESAF